MKRLATLILGVLVLVLAPRVAAQSSPELEARDLAALETRFRDVAEKVRPATVAILGLIGMGSGVIIDPSGLVLTNAHVALAAPHAAVVFPDGKKVLARRIGIYFPRDLALIQLPAGTYPAVEPAPVGSVRPGDWVVAYGHPGGLKPDARPTFSAGQVTGSVEFGPVAGVFDYSGGIESDVPIYSGNSGGPLFDLQGRFVGINGAVNQMEAASFTLSLEIIADVLPRLAEEKIILTDEIVLDPKDPALRAIFDLYEPMSLEAAQNWIRNGWPGEKMPGAAAAPRPARAGWLERLVESLDPGTPAAAKAGHALEGKKGAPRQDRLARAFAGTLKAQRARAVALESGDGKSLGLGTVIATGFVVTKASLLGDRRSAVLRLAPGEAIDATLVAANAEHDLALLSASGVSARGEDADGIAIGSWVVAPGADGTAPAIGVLSAATRGIPAAAESLLPGGLMRAVQWGLIRAFKASPPGSQMRQLAEQLEQADRARRWFEEGTDPRTYSRVLQHDAPVLPARMGGPVLDRSGRLVGINVGRPHHGTTYATPIRIVREVFAAHLKGR